MLFIIIYAVSLLGNITLGLYLIVHRLQTTIDRLVFNICFCELLLPILGMPFYQDIWLGLAYKYGVGGCVAMSTLFQVDEIYEAFSILLFTIYLKEKLSGEFRLFKGLLLNAFSLFSCAIILHIPYAAILSLDDEDQPSYCQESWNNTARILWRLIKISFLFLIPLALLLRVNYRSFRIISAFKSSFHQYQTKKRYRSVSNDVNGKDTPDAPGYNLLKFSESEEMNLEMNQLYERDEIEKKNIIDNENETSVDGPGHNTDGHITDRETTAKSEKTPLFSSEVSVDKISRDSPLWRDDFYSKTETQKLIFSKQWCSYISNLHKVGVTISMVFLLCQFPYFIMQIYSLMRNPISFTTNERTCAKVILVFKFLPSIINPWIMILGIKKYRDSILKCNRFCC